MTPALREQRAFAPRELLFDGESLGRTLHGRLLLGHESELAQELHLIEVEAVARHPAAGHGHNVALAHTDALSGRFDRLSSRAPPQWPSVRSHEVAFVNGRVVGFVLVD